MPTIQEELERQRRREIALQTGQSFDLSGGSLAQEGGIQAEGPGASSAAVIENLVAQAGANNAAKLKGVESVSPALMANPATTPVLESTISQEQQGPKKFKDLSKQEKTAAFLKLIGNALAVAASSDPGAALANQINAMAQEREILSARRQRARERREDRKFRRDQFTSEVRAQREREDRLAERRAKEKIEEREFDLRRDMEKFIRETGFRREESIAEREFRRQERSELRAEDKAEKRQGRISDLTLKLAPTLATIGENAEGQQDPLGRSRRIAAAIIDDDLDSLSDFDKAAFEFAIRKNDSPTESEQKTALIQAATKLVGKPQPIPRTEQIFMANGSPELDENGQPVFEVVRDPATGMVLPKLDSLGNVVEVPMSFEEALTAVSFGMEQREFFQTRTVDPAQAEQASQMQSIVVNPADIEPKHLLDSEGRIGLISAIAGHAQTGEERREIFEQFEEEMKSRGFDGFSPEVKKALEKHFNERDRTLDKASNISRLKASGEEGPTIRALRQVGENVEDDEEANMFKDEARRRSDTRRSRRQFL